MSICRPGSRFQHWVFAICLVGLLTHSLPASGDEIAVVTSIDGKKKAGIIKIWSADKLVITGDSPGEIPRQEIQTITFGNSVKIANGGQQSIWLSNGDRISARPVSIANDVLTLSWPLLEGGNALTIPLEMTAAAIFELPMALTDRLRLFADLETLPPGNDLVLLTNGDRSSGEIKQLDAVFVELSAAGSLLKLDRSRVRAVRFNPELTNAKRSTGRRVVVTLIDGSRITTTDLELTNGLLKLKSSGLGNPLLPLKSIHECQFFGERTIPLTDYEPAKIEYIPFLSGLWNCVRNANVVHGPLMLRGTEYATGLGMHSRMSVTYNLRGNERIFQSIVGIDDAANGAGSVVFKMELDGRPVWTSPELTGRSEAATVPEIDLRGSKQMTLIVDFGQFADVADYANWCAAVFIVDPHR